MMSPKWMHFGHLLRNMRNSRPPHEDACRAKFAWWVGKSSHHFVRRIGPEGQIGSVGGPREGLGKGFIGQGPIFVGTCGKNDATKEEKVKRNVPPPPNDAPTKDSFNLAFA